jgi:translation initiation factor IF-3
MKDQTLITLALPSESSKYPICTVFDRKTYEESERQRIVSEKEKEREEKRRAKGTKELEINWATAPHDLEIKMRRLREFLGKGLRVEVRLLSKKSKKKGKREATEDEAREVLKAVRKTALEDVVGAREVRPPDGMLLKKYTLFLEGPQGKRKDKQTEEVATEEQVAEAEATA